jgi:hypothetical protein
MVARLSGSARFVLAASMFFIHICRMFAIGCDEDLRIAT